MLDLLGKLTAEEINEINQARKLLSARYDAEANNEGQAIRQIRFVHQVVGRRPERKRQATAACGPKGRKDHGRISVIGGSKPNGVILGVVPVPPRKTPYALQDSNGNFRGVIVRGVKVKMPQRLPRLLIGKPAA